MAAPSSETEICRGSSSQADNQPLRDPGTAERVYPRRMEMSALFSLREVSYDMNRSGMLWNMGGEYGSCAGM